MKYIALLIVFIVGWFANSIYSEVFTFEEIPKAVDKIDNVAPGDHVKEKDVEVYDDKIVLNMPFKDKKYGWSRYAASGSMKPTLKEGHNGLEILKPDLEDINEGDILSYRFGKEIIVHRIVKLGYDDKGWYAITKGDANQKEDPYLVREDQIEALTIALVF